VVPFPELPRHQRFPLQVPRRKSSQRALAVWQLEDDGAQGSTQEASDAPEERQKTETKEEMGMGDSGGGGGR
jgi:hypothetical protein